MTTLLKQPFILGFPNTGTSADQKLSSLCSFTFFFNYLSECSLLDVCKVCVLLVISLEVRMVAFCYFICN